METRISEDQKNNQRQGILEWMDDFDLRILGVTKEKLQDMPIQFDVPKEDDLLRNPYDE